MKKGLLIINLILLTAILFACAPEMTKDKYSHQIFSMHTNISVQLLDITEAEAKEHFVYIENLYDKYDKLSDNFIPYEGINNLYKINILADNSNESITVDIEKELYDLLSFAYDIQLNSNGHFNIAMGKIIDVWKNLIETYQYDIIPEDELLHAKALVKSMDLIENPITLMTNNDKYYVTVKKGVKLDLGAIAKGYVTQLAIDYLHEKGIKNYSLNAGSSSMVLGEKVGEDPNFNIGLSNPLYTDNPINEPQIYGKIKIKNASITTSGSNLQKAVGMDGVWYHHIISPITKEPSNNFYSISLIGQDAGILDAYSTALFSMNADEIKEFLKEKDIEVIIFNVDETYTIINDQNRFEALRIKP